MEAPGDGFLLIPFFPEIIFRYSEAKIEGKLDRNGRFNPSLNFLACHFIFKGAGEGFCTRFLSRVVLGN